MASGETQGGSIQNEAQPPAAGVIPTYPEMIMAAIEALGDPNGSNKSSISKQIEATYGTLPGAYSTLLAHHLNRMKSSGQLIFLKNNYLKPDPNAPPRRGRGRPPKPKAPVSPGTLPSPSRPRGRPPKSRDPDAPPPPPKPKPVTAASSSSVTGRKRGRPPKAAGTAAVAAPPRLTSIEGAPRGRGRPPKVKAAVAAAVGA